ncbi:hypothetical protein C8F01DRAFT_1244834 [Mycena amicta]|nr:hypothetical protein C8F01DRAFT_1244834 [Mycena amicta]
MSDQRDPALLFSPAKTPRPPRRQVLDFVEAPILSPKTKGTYQEARFASVLKEAVPADEIIGEYTEGSTKWYYARYQAGIAHRYTAAEFEKQYPLLVAEYLRKRTLDELAPFSPTAHYVHPKSRVKLTLKLRTASISSNGSAPPLSDLDELTASDEEDEDSEEEED